MMAIGVVETNSIPLGVLAGDQMVKTAAVELVSAQTACAGKYIVMVSGEVAAVRAAVGAGVEAAASFLVDSLVIPNVDERVLTAMMGAPVVDQPQAVGVIETFSLASTISAADTAVKTSEVELIEVRLGRGMGGKSFLVFTGEVAAVEAAVKAIAASEGAKGLIGSSVVIPSPHMDMIRALL
jgi:microcompartment protein CcmL/EutN